MFLSGSSNEREYMGSREYSICAVMGDKVDTEMKHMGYILPCPVRALVNIDFTNMGCI